MIIGLSGYARSGKDTVAKFLVEEHGFTRLAFADPIRDAIKRLDPLITLNGMVNVRLSSALPKLGWERLKDDSPEIRPLLQRMGTEVGREMFGENFWVDYTINKARELNRNVVITDVRFTNEADAIRMWNGQVWRVNRPGTEPANDHPSETEMDSYPKFDAVIQNDTTIEDLFSELTPFVDSLKVHNGI
jgi:hypothetical protein